MSPLTAPHPGYPKTRLRDTQTGTGAKRVVVNTGDGPNGTPALR